MKSDASIPRDATFPLLGHENGVQVELGNMSEIFDESGDWESPTDSYTTMPALSRSFDCGP